MLRLNQRGPDDEKLSVVQSLLDESTQRVNQFCMENRWEILTICFSDVWNVRSFLVLRCVIVTFLVLRCVIVTFPVATQSCQDKSVYYLLFLYRITMIKYVLLLQCCHAESHETHCVFDGFGGLVVSILASGTQVWGFKPGRSRWIFTDVKILSMPSSGWEVKESVPSPSFAACKRT